LPNDHEFIHCPKLDVGFDRSFPSPPANPALIIVSTNHAATPKASELILAQWFLAFWLLSERKLAQIGKDWAQPVKLYCILFDDFIRVAVKPRRLKILSVLDNFLGHPFDQFAVIFLKDALGPIEFVFWRKHNQAQLYRLSDSELQQKPNQC
jgi:hypothetical protein